MQSSREFTGCRRRKDDIQEFRRIRTGNSTRTIGELELRSIPTNNRCCPRSEISSYTGSLRRIINQFVLQTLTLRCRYFRARIIGFQ